VITGEDLITRCLVLGEDAHATRTDEETDDDEDDAPENLTPEERQNSGNDQYDREDPQEKFHARQVPGAEGPKHRLRRPVDGEAQRRADSAKRVRLATNQGIDTYDVLTQP
jgi:hypothetical protein